MKAKSAPKRKRTDWEAVEPKLTERQKRFCEEYIVDLNGTQAAIRAGYSNKGAEVQASQLLSNPKVRAIIDENMRNRAQRVELTQDSVLKELKRLVFFDIRKIFNADGTLKRVVDLDDDTAAAIISVEMIEIGEDGQLSISKKFKSSDKKGSIELAMRHLGMLNDKLQLTIPQAIIKDMTGRNAS